jgi:hypothetical protein
VAIFDLNAEKGGALVDELGADATVRAAAHPLYTRSTNILRRLYI